LLQVLKFNLSLTLLEGLVFVNNSISEYQWAELRGWCQKDVADGRLFRVPGGFAKFVHDVFIFNLILWTLLL